MGGKSYGDNIFFKKKKKRAAPSVPPILAIALDLALYNFAVQPLVYDSLSYLFLSFYEIISDFHVLVLANRSKKCHRHYYTHKYKKVSLPI